MEKDHAQNLFIYRLFESDIGLDYFVNTKGQST